MRQTTRYCQCVAIKCTVPVTINYRHLVFDLYNFPILFLTNCTVKGLRRKQGPHPILTALVYTRDHLLLVAKYSIVQLEVDEIYPYILFLICIV